MKKWGEWTKKIKLSKENFLKKWINKTKEKRNWTDRKQRERKETECFDNTENKVYDLYFSKHESLYIFQGSLKNAIFMFPEISSNDNLSHVNTRTPFKHICRGKKLQNIYQGLGRGVGGFEKAPAMRNCVLWAQIMRNPLICVPPCKA